MKILIDADGCPVVNITIQVSREYHLPCLLLCDTSHEFYRSGAETIVFDKGMDSVDYGLVNRVEAGDLVITQDYGLASMCLARGAAVMNQDGWEYTPENIDVLLFSRYESRKYRAAGGRTKGPSKRSNAQNKSFETALRKLLHTAVQG